MRQKGPLFPKVASGICLTLFPVFHFAGVFRGSTGNMDVILWGVAAIGWVAIIIWD